jgi:hypothetical protein
MTKLKLSIITLTFLSYNCFAININQNNIEYKQNVNVELSKIFNINKNTIINISNEVFKYVSFENEYFNQDVSKCQIIDNKSIKCDTTDTFDIVLDIEENGVVSSKNFKMKNINVKDIPKEDLYDELISRNAELSTENNKINHDMSLLKEEIYVLKKKTSDIMDINNKVVGIEQEKSDLQKENELLKKRVEYLLKECKDNKPNISLNSIKEEPKNLKNEPLKVEVIDENGPKLSSSIPNSDLKNVMKKGKIKEIIIGKKVVEKKVIVKKLKEPTNNVDNSKLKDLLKDNFN